MRALKNNWLSAGITLLFLLGAFFVVRAMEEEKVPTVKKEKVVLRKQWYSVSKINPAGLDIPSNFQIVGTTPAPPLTTNPNDCTQTNLTGKYCAFELEFDNSQDEESVIGLTLAEAMQDLDATETGKHARNPSLL